MMNQYNNNNSSLPIASGLMAGLVPPPMPPQMPPMPPSLPSWEDTPIPEDWNSIYIPRIDFRMTREELSYLMECILNMGKVSRIDFAPTKDGSGRMAYIHMEFNQEPQTVALREMIAKDSWEVYPEYNVYPIKLRFLVNRRPVPKTEFTIETLTDSMSRMSYTVEQHGVDIAALQNDNAYEFTRIENLLIDMDDNMKGMDEDMAILEQDNRVKMAEQEVRIQVLEKTVREQEECLLSTMKMVREMEYKMHMMMDKFNIVADIEDA
jgi:hypothetical protein